MKRLNTKSKKTLAVTGISVGCICMALIVGIAVNKGSIASANTTSEVESITTSIEASEIEITVDEITSSPSISVPPIKKESAVTSTQNQAAFVPKDGNHKSSALTNTSKPTSKPPKPTIKGDSSTTSNGKKQQPKNPALTDKNNKPSYSSKPTVTKPSSSTPKAGETKDGKSYVPGFGWVEGTGAGGEGTVAEDMYEDGVKVGIMD